MLVSGEMWKNCEKTILTFSPLVTGILTSTFNMNLSMQFHLLLGVTSRQLRYFLASSIYPTGPIFVLPIHDAPTEGQRWFSTAQEGTRKYIERFFGVMQARFRILRRESELWSGANLVCVTEVSVIIHSLLVRMSQSGAFDEEVMDERHQVNLVKQFLDEEEAHRAEQGEEVASREAQDTAKEFVSYIMRKRSVCTQ